MSINQERRRTKRRDASEHGVAMARIRPGHHVQLIDLSAGGALVEADRRMLPGSAVELQLHAEDRQATLRGCVVRCSVVRVRPASVSYRGAIAFDRQLAWFGDAAGYDVPFGGEVTPLGI
jgi:PilZ domain